MSKQNTMMRVSLKNSENLKILKNELGLASYDEVVSYLIEANLKGNSEGNLMVEMKKTLEKGLSVNEKRTEAVHKRLGHLDKYYFTKILDTHNLLKEFLASNLKAQNTPEKSEVVQSSGSNIEIKKLEKELNDVWESHREMEEINKNLNTQVNMIKGKFKFESGAFSKSYKAVLSVQEFKDIFE